MPTMREYRHLACHTHQTTNLYQPQHAQQYPNKYGVGSFGRMENEEPYDPLTFNLIRQALVGLEEQGIIEVIGISDDGDEVYQITEKGMKHYMSHQMDFDTWVRIGYEAGWCSPPMCYTHDGLPMTVSEDEEMMEGDPCLHIVRLYDSPEQKKGCEANNPAAIWRATNLGWEHE